MGRASPGATGLFAGYRPRAGHGTILHKAEFDLSECPDQNRSQWVASTAGGKAAAVAEQLGLSKGMVVQELGWDDDVDDDLRIAVEDALDAEMVEEAMEACDAVLLWWREDDGDLADGLVDALTDLADTGWIWLLTPKVGRDGHVDPAEVAEAATTAGLQHTSTAPISEDWVASKLVRPKGSRR
ncbi:hypothetical protein BI335_00320 [Enemella evansiae]|nr:hypothetical protein BI335_00320 [Enemella evansiae]